LLQVEQARLVLLLQAVVWYSPLTHAVHVEQNRSVVAVQSVVW
jgi:hypothetical protein